MHADNHRGAKHAEHLDRRPVEQQRSADYQGGAASRATEGGFEPCLAVLVIVHTVGHGDVLRFGHRAAFTQLTDALVNLELWALLELARHDRNHDGRDCGKDEATLPADDRQQQRGQPGGDQRTDRPAALHQAVDKATALGQARIFRGTIQLAQVRGVDGFLGIPQATQRTDQNQRRLAPRPANRGQCRAQRGTGHGENNAFAPAQLIDDRANRKGDHRRAHRHPGRDFSLLHFTPAKVPADLRQQGAEQDEVIHRKHPGEKRDPGGKAHFPGRQLPGFPASQVKLVVDGHKSRLEGGLGRFSGGQERG
ncbi:hypothetical protein ALQ35_05753 [Pseudomonas fluorescens]|nr:hypothetical protein ALQ35_05753 [Pseudomonas fluorescens]